MASNTPRLDSHERNLIINGNMDFWQRGITFGPSTGQPTTLADRFVSNVGATGVNTYTVTQSTDIPTFAQSGFQSRYSFSWAFTGAVTNNGELLRYPVEGQDYQAIHGKKFRLQFWVKSATTGTYSVSFTNGAGNRNLALTYTIAAANTWQKVNLDVAAETVNTGWSFDNTAGMNIWFGVSGTGAQPTVAAGNAWSAGGGRVATTQVTQASGGSFLLTQVMLVPVDFTTAGATLVDIPYHRCGYSIGHELMMCQRYYEKSFEITTTPANGGTATSFATNNGVHSLTAYGNTSLTLPINGAIKFKVDKRGTPTITIYGNNTAQTYGATSTSGSESWSAAWIHSPQPETTGFRFDQEVTPGINTVLFHWTAESEL